jgi:hypothetical protein
VWICKAGETCSTPSDSSLFSFSFLFCSLLQERLERQKEVLGGTLKYLSAQAAIMSLGIPTTGGGGGGGVGGGLGSEGVISPELRADEGEDEGKKKK